MTSKLWWLVHKDLIIEYRSRQSWPVMLVLGILVALLFSLQVELPSQYRPAVAGTLLWLAIMFAGLVAIERSSAAEQQNGCWQGLRQYPLPPSLIYVAKLLTNFIALLVLVCVLVPMFGLLTDASFLRGIWPIMVVSVLASLGIAAVGTLVAALTHGLRQQSALLSVLALPLLAPAILAAAEATRLIGEGQLNDTWWRGIQFLVCYAVIFSTLGAISFGALVED